MTRDQGSSSENVAYLHRRPGGRLYRLADFFDEADPLRWVSIGRGSHCDIVVADKHVSEEHCLILCTDRSVIIRDDESYNLTLVNSVPLHGSEAHLVPGSLIEIGTTRFVACDASGVAQLALFTTNNLHDHASEAADVYGSETKAAEALDVPPRSFSRWLKNGRLCRRKRREP